MKALAFFAAVSLLAIGTGTAAFAAELPVPARAETEKPKLEIKKVTGTVSAVTRSGIAVEINAGGNAAEELFIPVDGKTKVEKAKSLLDLKMDDVVTVDYERLYRLDEKGGKVFLGTRANRIALVKAARPVQKNTAMEGMEEGLASQEAGP